MRCAVVLVVNDWDVLNEAYGIDRALDAIAACGLSQPYHILIAEGFERIPAELVARWGERNIRIEDVSAIVASLRADYPWLAGLPDNPTYRVTMVRHLVLERLFAGEAVLSVDMDVIWRMDPYRLFGDWRGGFFALGGGGSLTFADSAEWFATYRQGLESALTGGALTADFSETKFRIDKVQHDQHLIRHLFAKGLMANAWDACHRSPALAGLSVTHNPLYPKDGLVDPPERLQFERSGGEERMGGAPVAFWHMQSSFVMLCAFLVLAEALKFDHHGRLPFPRPKTGKDNLKAGLLHQLRELIIAGHIDDERFSRLRPQMFRRGIYRSFFEGDLPHRLFTDERWWEPRIFS